jgi:hypothetical protein
MQRAGPEIFRNCLAHGTTTIRGWLSQEYSGTKSGAKWEDLWHHATQVDFRLNRANTNSEKLAILAVDDGCEVSLRNIASDLYRRRTGDHTGANHMLAIRVPGQSTDLAPSWLVDQVATHSRQEYNTAQRSRGHQVRDGDDGGDGVPRHRQQQQQRGGGGGRARGSGDQGSAAKGGGGKAKGGGRGHSK